MNTKHSMLNVIYLQIWLDSASLSNSQENSHFPSSDGDDEGHVELEDYRPIDPVPSSKASIRPGPIQHGTPLMPYIPKPCPSPPPPSQQPKHGGWLFLAWSQNPTLVRYALDIWCNNNK